MSARGTWRPMDQLIARPYRHAHPDEWHARVVANVLRDMAIVHNTNHTLGTFSIHVNLESGSIETHTLESMTVTTKDDDCVAVGKLLLAWVQSVLGQPPVLHTAVSDSVVTQLHKWATLYNDLYLQPNFIVSFDIRTLLTQRALPPVWRRGGQLRMGGNGKDDKDDTSVSDSSSNGPAIDDTIDPVHEKRVDDWLATVRPLPIALLDMQSKRKLGQGSWGTVWLVPLRRRFGQQQQQYVVLKQIPIGQGIRAKLMQENLVLRQLATACGSPPYLHAQSNVGWMCASTVYRTAQAYYLEMENLKDYVTLDDLLHTSALFRESDQATWGPTTQVMVQLMQQLQKIHALGIAHRDIKPGNIMVHPTTWHVKYIDFGEACLRTATPFTPPTPAQVPHPASCLSPHPLGSPNFMSPEMIFRCQNREWLEKPNALGHSRLTALDVMSPWYRAIQHEQKLWIRDDLTSQQQQQINQKHQDICTAFPLKGPSYMDTVDGQRADLWALGCTLWAIVYSGLVPRPVSGGPDQITPGDIWAIRFHTRFPNRSTNPWSETVEFLAQYDYTNPKDLLSDINSRVEQWLATLSVSNKLVYKLSLTKLLSRNPEQRSLKLGV